MGMITSAVVRTDPDHLASVLADLEECSWCDVHFHDPAGKIVITIDSVEATDSAVDRMRELRDRPHVLAVDLAAVYRDDPV